MSNVHRGIRVCVWCAQVSEGVGVEAEVCAKLCTWCLCVQGVLIFSTNYSSILFKSNSIS